MEFRMPQLGADMQAGRLVAWLKQPGDQIARGETLAEVDTDKGVIEIEAFTAGVLERTLIEPGEKVPAGTVLAIIRVPGETEAPVATPAPAPVAPGLPSPREQRPRVSPLARKLAAQLGVDLATLSGTGVGGAVTRADVERAAATPPAAPEAEPSRSLRMRQAIAAAMARSKREIPHYYLATTVDLGAAMTWLERENRARPVTERLLPVALFLKATALALREVPELNGVWERDHAVTREEIHLGTAISLRDGGLVAPAIHHADRLSLGELMRQFLDLVNRTRAGRLRSSELADSTVTVTCLGERGVETVYGVIFPPQVALVGFGKVVERPVALGAGLMVRPVVTVTLSADHRVSDGHRGSRFLAALERLLQEPASL